MSNRIEEPTEKILIDKRWFWLVPYHVDNQGTIAYMLGPVAPSKSKKPKETA